jgi:hypothetical protein
MSQLIAPLSLVVRFFVSALLLGVPLAALSLAVVASASILAKVAGNVQVASLLTVAATITVAVELLVTGWLFWAWPFIVSDGRETALGSLKLAWTLTMNQKLTSTLILLIAIFLTATGTVVCNIGHIVTGPVTLLVFALGYLHLTGQWVDQA